MGVIKVPKTRLAGNKPAFNALHAAALMLPGMLPSAVDAVEDAEITLQYGRYQEGDRHVNSIETLTNPGQPEKINIPQHFKPIEADSLLTSIKAALTDRLTFSANFSQDTWAGATPVATAPAVFGGNGVTNGTGGPDGNYFADGVVTGASPYLSTLSNANRWFDSELNPQLGYLQFSGGIIINAERDTELAHTMAQASPETRRQGDFTLNYEWDNMAVSVGGGISVERDYESRFYNLGGRFDFNQKLTSLDVGLSYTNSATDALVDHHVNAYIALPGDAGLVDDTSDYGFSIDVDSTAKTRRIRGRRQDWGFNVGLSQVLGKNTVANVGLKYTYSHGYMSNPYKAVMAFYDLQDLFASGVLRSNSANAFFERRPLERNQLVWDARVAQHFEGLDASMHVNYQFTHDDWGIHTHTLEANWIQSLGFGWSVTPRIRYYSQSEADFYTPYMVFREASPDLPDHFSSDHRLSGFGAITGGLVLKKQFAKGVSLEAGVEYYTHQGELKLGGDGEGSYADFDYYAANATLNVQLSKLGRGLVDDSASHNHALHGAPLPAGVMFGHMLEKSGQWMFGYRYHYQHASGDLLQGTQGVSDIHVVNNGCEGDVCHVAPTDMAMHMHMFNIMYAPTDWLTLMLMPQLVDMSMEMRELEGKPAHGSETTTRLGIAISHTRHEHITGGLGDTGLFALFKLFDSPNHNVHMSLGFNAPTGESDFSLRGAHGFAMGYIHYGMQVGSGTWDFRPSLTYTGQWNDISWGAQFNATQRIGKNDQGFAFGDIVQGTAWGGYRFSDWLSASVRGIYTSKGHLRGSYEDRDQQIKVGSMDYTSNYGGEYWDLGLGITASVAQGDFAGNRVSFEWLQPLVDDVNGYQRERDGALTVTWSYMF